MTRTARRRPGETPSRRPQRSYPSRPCHPSRGPRARVTQAGLEPQLAFHLLRNLDVLGKWTEVVPGPAQERRTLRVYVNDRGRHQFGTAVGAETTDLKNQVVPGLVCVEADPQPLGVGGEFLAGQLVQLVNIKLGRRLF